MTCVFWLRRIVEAATVRLDKRARFPGQRYDALTGLYANGRRDCDSAVGRYMQPDPIGLNGGVNPYLYANGSPIFYTDPTGELGIVGAGIGAAVEIAIQALHNYAAGCDYFDFRNYKWSRIGIAAFFGSVSPGWLAVGKAAYRSSQAIRVVARRIPTSQTANRVGKLQRSISDHRKQLMDKLGPQMALQGAGFVGKEVAGRAGQSACGCIE